MNIFLSTEELRIIVESLNLTIGLKHLMLQPNPPDLSEKCEEITMQLKRKLLTSYIYHLEEREAHDKIQNVS